MVPRRETRNLKGSAAAACQEPHWICCCSFSLEIVLVCVCTLALSRALHFFPLDMRREEGQAGSAKTGSQPVPHEKSGGAECTAVSYQPNRTRKDGQKRKWELITKRLEGRENSL